MADMAEPPAKPVWRPSSQHTHLAARPPGIEFQVQGTIGSIHPGMTHGIADHPSLPAWKPNGFYPDPETHIWNGWTFTRAPSATVSASTERDCLLSGSRRPAPANLLGGPSSQQLTRLNLLIDANSRDAPQLPNCRTISTLCPVWPIPKNPVT